MTGWTLQIGGRRLSLEDGEHALGRDPDSAVMLSDGTVSRHHALLTVDGGRVALKDLGSANGTFVDDRRVRDEVELAEGDRLRLGRVRLTLSRGGDDAAGSGPRRFCPRCGTRVHGDDAVCPRCGDDLTRDRPMSRSEAVAMSEVMPVGEALASPSHRRARPAMPSEWDVEVGGEGYGGAGGESGGGAADDTATTTIAVAPAAAGEDESVAETPSGPLYQPAAGLPLRTLALLADVVWLAALGWAASRLGGGPLAGVAVAAAAWVVVSLAGWSQWGTTPGKRLFGLYVCDLDGRPGVGPLRAARRLLGCLLSAAAVGLGFLRVGLAADRRGWHDHLAGTYVARIVQSAPRGRALP